MRNSRFILILVCGLFAVLFNSCAENQTSNGSAPIANRNQNANSKREIVARDDVEELGKIIRLPFAPEEATYIETETNGKKRLVAVLLFTAENANQIVEQSKKTAAPAPLDVEAESWFPPELIAKSQETGDEVLKGISFPANDFSQSPYTNGRVTRINDTNYLVLELASQ